MLKGISILATAVACIIGIVSCSIFFIGSAYVTTFIIGCLSAIILGASVTLTIRVKMSPKYKVASKIPGEIRAIQTLASAIKLDVSSSSNFNQGIKVSRKIDVAINEILDSFINIKISPWFSPLVHDTTASVDIFRNVLWCGISSLHTRFSKVDRPHFIMCGIVHCLTSHLEQIRISEATGEAKGERGVFNLVPQLSSPVRERNFLRLVSEFLIVKSLPAEYHKCNVLRTLLKELVACRVLEPLIDRLCDPVWINQLLLRYLRQKKAVEEIDSRTLHYASTYEHFITLINDSTDTNDLKHLRSSILNEIMQATAINNLKKAKGVDIYKDSPVQNAGKYALLETRNLKRYISQLTYAKVQCERRIAGLSSKDSTTDSKEPRQTTDEDKSLLSDFNVEHGPVFNSSSFSPSGQKILTFHMIMESAFARRYFSIYLDEIGEGSLLSFWSSVQDLKESDKKLHYQLGMEIYHTFLVPHHAPIKADKVCIRGVEAFLLGNRGPEVLFEIAEDVEKTLEDKNYPGFLMSSTYKAMLAQGHVQNIDFISTFDEFSTSDKMSFESGLSDGSDGSLAQLSDHSSYARNKLAHLQEKLTNKLLALQAIQQTNKADPKVINHLEGEIATIRNDHKDLETHVDRTTDWSDNIGHWRVFVQDVQESQEKEGPNLQLVIYLECDSSKLSEDNFISLLSSGWAVTRKLSHLVELHRKLCQITPELKQVELPTSQLKMIFNKQLDKQSLEKVRLTSQNYFSVVMSDEKLSGSELIYAFLASSPQHLKQHKEHSKKAKFSFTTLFKSNEGKPYCDEEELSNLILTDQSDHGIESDSIVEPLFAFLEELCELRGGGKWLRKTLVTFVQITYGKNITRYIREAVQGLFSESMVVYYLHNFRDSFLPTEELPPEDLETELSPDEIERIRQEAQEQFLQNLPDLFVTLVGQQNSKRGAQRLFCTLQHHALNKNLFYKISETVLKEAFPELGYNLTKKISSS